MDEITFDEGLSRALQSLITDRLALLAGAGLSMAPPSSLPSAAELARTAKRKYDAMFGPGLPPLSTDIAEQAQYFFERDELATVYFRTLVDHDAFAAPPNPGHYAIADLLLVRAIQPAMTTNVDTMIESAGKMLFGQVASGIDGITVARAPLDTSPLLKLHGCRDVDPENMVWAPGQLRAAPVAHRIETSKDWLRGRLTDRDLLVVGFATDWDYLNDLLEATLGAAHPASVLVIDPSPSAAFAGKAPELFRLGERTGVNFRHVRASGADFLDQLRCAFSKSYVRRVLAEGVDLYEHACGVAPAVAWVAVPDLTNQELWSLRRDLEGRLPGKPASERSPTPRPVLALTLLQLQARGAELEGHHWSLDGQRLRVISAEGKALHDVAAAFSRTSTAPISPELLVAVGAEDIGLPSHIVRSATTATVARGTASRFITRSTAVEEFGL